MENILNEINLKCGELKNIDSIIRKKRREEKKELRNKRNDLLKSIHSKMDILIGKMEERTQKNKLVDFPANELVMISNAIGNYLSYKVKMNKIRKFLDSFRRIQTKFDLEQIVLLRPKLAYAVGRTDGEEKEFMKRFMRSVDLFLIKISNEKEFEKVLKFIESIIAYHRYHGGSDA